MRSSIFMIFATICFMEASAAPHQQFAKLGDGGRVVQINNPGATGATQVAFFKGRGTAEQDNKENAKNNTQIVFGGHTNQRSEKGSQGNNVINFRNCSPGENNHVVSDGSNARFVSCIAYDLKQLFGHFERIYNRGKVVRDSLKYYNLM